MSYFGKKLTSMLASLFVIVTATFFLMRFAPGDPFSEEQALPTEVIEALKEHYGLNDPWYIQYVRYLKGVATLDLGPSYKYKARTVNQIIAEGFPISALLGAEALLLALGGGVALGTIAALKHNRWQDYTAMTIAVLGVSIPSFILASLLQYILALKLDLLPVARWGSWAHTVLPAVSLAAMPLAFIARLVRSNMLEVLTMDYIKTARAKGLARYQVVYRHAMRNALLPVVSYLGQLTANIFVGSFVIERIFGIPGLGQWLVNSVSNRDYTVIMGLTVFYATLLLTMIFLVDVLYRLLDPRIRTGARQ